MLARVVALVLFIISYSLSGSAMSGELPCTENDAMEVTVDNTDTAGVNIVSDVRAMQNVARGEGRQSPICNFCAHEICFEAGQSICWATQDRQSLMHLKCYQITQAAFAARKLED